MFLWEIRLFDFDKKLLSDLEKHAEKYDYEKIPSLNETIVCEMLFRSSFPEKPPVVRVKRPRLVHGTGLVSFSGTFDTFGLLNKEWKENTDVSEICIGLRNQIIDGKARINMKTNNNYDVNTFKETYKRSRKKDDLKKFINKNGYKIKMMAYSLPYVQKKFCSDFYPKHDIEKGNNIILPQSSNL
jgi:hypothetical protein